MNMKPMAGPALAAVDHGFTKFVPKQWENTYYAWLRDIQDWCISRQLWWGHRIPAWYDPQGKVYVARTFEEACEQAGRSDLVQDPDVLDTWFSSALWPFSVFGWPNKTEDLARYYPTSVLVTGFDIIFFWVARMMFAGIHFMGEVPFRDVYIHALVRDENGDKMSKTKGNVVDPLTVIDEWGADAFRFTMVAFAAQGRDVLWNPKRVEANHRFQTKIWQSLRYAFMHAEGYDPHAPMEYGPYERWIQVRTGQAVAKVRQALDEYKFNEVANEIQAFVWGEFCDWYLELSKTTVYDDAATPAAKNAVKHTLFQTMGVIVRLLHPIMPFLTEEIWQRLPGSQGFVAMASYPKVSDFPADDGVLDLEDLASVDPLRCRDVDLDACDDCSSGVDDPSDDGIDTDGDTLCDASDPLVMPDVLLDTDDVPWTPGGIGAPTVIYDEGSGLLVMAYETQTGTSANCPVGTWGLGLATSADGLTWTDIGGALLAATPGTFYACVAAHPGLLDRSPGQLVLFFKGEQGSDACDSVAPSWGCGQYTGVGRASLTWNATTEAYDLTGPDTEPVILTGSDFGYPKGVHHGGTYHVAFLQQGAVYLARGSASLDTVTGPVWSTTEADWAMTTLRSPSPTCIDDTFRLFVEGDANLGALDGDALDTLGLGPAPLLSVAAGDPLLKHHDSLRLADGGWWVVFDTPGGPGGTNHIRYAVTDPAWAPSDLRSKSCLSSLP